MAQSYVQTNQAVKEDLLDILINLSPTERQLTSGLGTSSAKNIRHENLIDTLAAAATNAYIQGADACFRALTNPTRLANYVQTMAKGFMVPNIERELDTAGFEDRFKYESTKALTELGNDLELALMRGSMASGSGTVASQLRGLKNSLSLVTSQSGVSLTESILEDRLQAVWDNTSSEVNALYGDMYIKRKISGFRTGLTVNLSADDKRLQKSVDVYQADAAKLVKLFAHRYVTISGDTNHDVVGANENFFKVAYVRKPKFMNIAPTGDATKGEVVADATLEVRHYNAGFWSKQHL